MPDAILCLCCGHAEHLIRRRWWMGRRECWWCGYCRALTPVLAVQGCTLGVSNV